VLTTIGVAPRDKLDPMQPLRMVATVVLGVGCGRVGFDELATDAPAPARPCGTLHTFCDDFDRPPPVIGDWDTEIAQIGTLALDASRARSAPQSLLVTIPPHAGGSVLGLELALTSIGNRLSFSFDLAIEESEVAPEIDLVQVVWAVPPVPCGPGFGVYLVKESNSRGIAVQETSPGCGMELMYHSTPDTDVEFHHYEMVIDTTTDGVQLRRDDATIVDVVAEQDLPAGAAISIRVGAPSTVNGVNTSWQLRYDDVIVDVE